MYIVSLHYSCFLLFVYLNLGLITYVYLEGACEEDWPTKRRVRRYAEYETIKNSNKVSVEQLVFVCDSLN